ncbi:MAG: four helix bundle protein [bacterium]|nr:four helix bundle protein [bacterium]
MEKPHKKLDTWKISMDLVTEIYKLTNNFPEKEIYCLTPQIRRAAISIPSNIAEGAARNTKKEFINFLHIAQGSLSELDTQIEIAKRLEYLKENDWKSLDEMVIRIDKMLSGLIKQLKNSIKREG